MTTMQGIVGSEGEVTERMFKQGKECLEALVRAGHVVHNK